MEKNDFGISIDQKLLDSVSDGNFKISPLDQLDICILVRHYLNYLKVCSFELTDVSDLRRIKNCLKRLNAFVDDLLSFNENCL